MAPILGSVVIKKIVVDFSTPYFGLNPENPEKTGVI